MIRSATILHLKAAPELQPQLQQIALFDLLINNADRKSGHILLQAAEIGG
jgi:hypothetical protein